MNEVRLRITPEGTIRGLWTDELNFRQFGPLRVTRASHVEFDNALQCWTVRATRRGLLRRVIDRLLGRKGGPVLYQAGTRVEALAWEQHSLGRRQGEECRLALVESSRRRLATRC